MVAGPDELSPDNDFETRWFREQRFLSMFTLIRLFLRCFSYKNLIKLFPHDRERTRGRETLTIIEILLMILNLNNEA